MRDLTLLINSMLEHIPQTEEYLRACLESVNDSLIYTPPEPLAQMTWFVRVAEIFEEVFPDPNKITEEWQKIILRTWMADDTLFR